MQRLYLGCIVLSGLAMVAITLMIPSGVFMRYVMNGPLQWPEPGVGAHDGVLLVPRRRGGVPRQRAHRGGGADRAVGAEAARHAMGRARLHGRPSRVHAGLRRAPLHGSPGAPRSPSFPGCRSASSTCRSRSAACSRCSSSSSSSGSASRRSDDVMYSDQPVGAGVAHGRPRPARLVRAAVRARRAGRLRARPGRAHRRALGRHPARGGDAQDLRRHRRLRAAGDPVLRAGRRHHGRGRHGGAPGRLSPRCSSASSAAAWRWSTSWRARSSAASRARRWPTPRRSAR